MAIDIEKSEKHKLLHMSEISLMLDTYDDIFSDFDPRPYSMRALSDDFLIETKKASKDKPSGEIELKLMIPKHERGMEKEKLIKKRLRDHFKHHHDLLHEEIQKLQIQGALIAIIGFILMGTAVLLGDLNLTQRITNMLLVVLEPTGWFAMWFGFDKIFYTAGNKRSDLAFYEKMIKCEITFLPY